MSLSSALNIALSGLRVTNSGVNLAARNIANANTPGYTTKAQLPQYYANGGVFTGAIQRDVDIFVQQQLRTEVAIGAQVDIRAEFLSRIDNLFGRPGEANALDTILNGMDTALQSLVTTPEDAGARTTVINEATTVAAHLNRLSDEVQAMRREAEIGISDAVSEANLALQEIARLNSEIQARFDDPAGFADLEDQRDRFIDGLSQLVDIKVIEAERGATRVFTKGGNLLVDNRAATLEFDERSSIDASALYDFDDAVRGVGTVKLTSFGGAEIDLFRSGDFGAGKIEALRELRDETLVQAQAQLDELAHALAISLSGAQVNGTAATVGAQTGFDINVADLISGNNLSVTVTQGGIPQNFTFIRVDDPASLPLSNDATASPNDTVIGIDFSGGLAGAAAAIDAALDAALGVDVSVSSSGANTLQILNDAGGTVTIDSVGALVTPAATQDNGLQLAVFTDIQQVNQLYSGSFDGGSQKVGFAGRIVVNPDLLADNSLLVSYSTTPPTGNGDASRPLELLARFSETPFTFSPVTGIGGTSQPVSTSVREFGQRIISFQGQQAQIVKSSQEAQSIIVGAVYDRYQADTAVNTDDELARLTELQNAYAANARVMSVVQDLVAILIQI